MGVRRRVSRQGLSRVSSCEKMVDLEMKFMFETQRSLLPFRITIHVWKTI